jgi:hypothetical protein
MALISPANLKSICDFLSASWNLLTPSGLKTGGVVTGTVRDFVNKALNVVVVSSADLEQETDLGQNFNSALQVANQSDIANVYLATILGSIDSHIQRRGGVVNASISNLATFLTYYNGGAGGAKFSSLLTPEFSDIYYARNAVRLPGAGIMSPAINPANGAASGLGTRAVGGAFADGLAPDLTKYSEVGLVAVTTVNFAAGTAPPSITVAGVDDTGAATTTWTNPFVGNNPTAVIGTTLSAPVTAWSRQTVAVASITGIAPGSWLTLEAGTVNEELILVEAVAGANITAVFKKAHAGASAVAGNSTIALTPSVAGRRCRDVTGITINITGHSAGTVRIDGVQDRVAV